MGQRKNSSGWTTVTMRTSLHEKLKKVFRAHGGKEVFGNLHTFIDVMLDVIIHTDTEVLHEILREKDKRLKEHPEFRSLLEELRRETYFPRRSKGDIPASTHAPEPKTEEDDDVLNIDIPPYQQL